MLGNEINIYLQSFRNDNINYIFNLITLLGSFFTVLVIYILLYFAKSKNASIYFLLNISLMFILLFILKKIFHSTRPYTENYILNLSNEDLNSNYSFPSGHSAIAAFIPSFLGFYYKKKRYFFLFSITLLVMLSRLYLGVHYIQDVVTGFIIGIYFGFFSKYIKKLICIKKTDFRYLLILFFVLTIFLIYKIGNNYNNITYYFLMFNLNLSFIFMYFESTYIKLKEKKYYLYYYFIVLVSFYLLFLNKKTLINFLFLNNFLSFFIYSCFINIILFVIIPFLLKLNNKMITRMKSDII